MGYWKKKYSSMKLGMVYQPPQCFPSFSILLEKTTSSSFPIKQGGVEKKSPKINAAGSVYGTILSEPNYILGQ